MHSEYITPAKNQQLAKLLSSLKNNDSQKKLFAENSPSKANDQSSAYLMET